MTKLKGIIILICVVIIGFWGGNIIGFFTYEPKNMPETLPKETLYETRKEPTTRPKIEIEPVEIEPVEFDFPTYTMKMWTYYFPDYKTGKAVGIKAISLDEARKVAEIQGLGTKDVLSNWKQ